MASVDASALDNTIAESRRWPMRRVLAAFVVALALISSVLTFAVLTGLTPVVPGDEVVALFLAINSGAILLLIGIILGEIWLVVQARRRGRAAARLHVQIVALFSAIAMVPAIYVAVVAYVTIDRGLDRLFSKTTRAAVENAWIIANGYMNEHAQLIGGEALALAEDLAHARVLFDQDPGSFTNVLRASTRYRKLLGAVIIDANANIVTATDQQDVINGVFDIPKPEDLVGLHEDKPPLIVVFAPKNNVAAALKLRGFNNLYLIVAQSLDPDAVARVQQTRESLDRYNDQEATRPGVQRALGLMFAVIALTVLMSAVLIALNFANSLVAPIRRLMGAADLVSTGNLNVQVPVLRSEGDLAQLGKTFNKMTDELRTQRDDLVRASEVIDSRRRFTEAVLSSASAGIIGVDGDGKIGILNRSSEKLIGHPEAEALGHPLSEIVPELDEIMASAREGVQRLVQGQVTVSRGGRERILSVRVSAELSGQSHDSYIITLDDITDLVSAQRTSAWADIARRIAHEIKNPLTPIQLSAERIRRKYGKVITEDRAVFDQCTDTIVRQVDDIRRMVDEFSKFARMPKAVIDSEDVADTVRQTVFLMRVGHPDIDIEADIKQDPMPAQFDRRLISQGLTNIIKNATEAIAAVPPEELGRGRIDVTAQREGDDIVIDVVDNGIGLPKESRSRLLEPYVTTREKGTGLGLAIVGRVLEEHGGRIELNDAASIKPGQRGAWMRLRFAVNGQAPAPIDHAAPATAPVK
jgi:two-component system, NtrC family, nitrogen regulation sensor histidine kinase NtrY